jgi:hypothetical protein
MVVEPPLTITMSLGFVYVETKIKDGKQITSSASHFDRHGGAPV